MGSEGMILSRVVSNFLIKVEAEFEKDSSFLVTQNNVFRFKIACTLFLSLIGTKDNPTLIFTDDTQWADEMSIDLIKSFIKNSDSRGILFCMAFRDDELDAQKLVFSEGNVDEYLHCTEISLENLNDIQVIAMLSSILGLPAESVSPLVNMIYEQTRGNSHSTVELIGYLKSSKALFYSEKTCSWEWSLLEIKKVLSNNPGEVVAKKMKGLDMVSLKFSKWHLS